MRYRRLVIFAVLLLPLAALLVLAYSNPNDEPAQPQAAQDQQAAPKPRYKTPTNREEALEFYTKRLAELEATSEEDWIKQNALSDGSPSPNAPTLTAVKQAASNELDRVRLMSDDEWHAREEQKKQPAKKP